MEDQNPKRRLVDGFTTTYKIHGLRPNTRIDGITVRGRNEFGWGPSNMPALVGRSSAAPPSQVEWIDVVSTGPYSAHLKWSAPAEDHGAAISNYKVRVPHHLKPRKFLTSHARTHTNTHKHARAEVQVEAGRQLGGRG